MNWALVSHQLSQYQFDKRQGHPKIDNDKMYISFNCKTSTETEDNIHCAAKSTTWTYLHDNKIPITEWENDVVKNPTINTKGIKNIKTA